MTDGEWRYKAQERQEVGLVSQADLGYLNQNMARILDAIPELTLQPEDKAELEKWNGKRYLNAFVATKANLLQQSDIVAIASIAKLIRKGMEQTVDKPLDQVTDADIKLLTTPQMNAFLFLNTTAGKIERMTKPRWPAPDGR